MNSNATATHDDVANTLEEGGYGAESKEGSRLPTELDRSHSLHPSPTAGRLHALLHYDFCPGANRWVYWLKRPEASLAVAGIIALACGFFVQPLAFVPFAAILLTLLLGHVWPWLAVRGISCEMRFLQMRATEGEAVPVRLVIRNRCPWPVWGLSLQGGMVQEQNRAESHTAAALARVRGWSTTEFDWDFRPECRGIYPLSQPILSTGFPFGLVRMSKPVSVAAQLTVWPAVQHLDILMDAAEASPAEEFCCEHRAGDCGDVIGTRPFRKGDSLRRIHWSQTARKGELIVTERQASTKSSIRLILDLNEQIHSPAGPQSTLEWGIRFTASIAACYLRQHTRVDCLLGDKLLSISSSGAGWGRFMDELAAIRGKGKGTRTLSLRPKCGRTFREPLTFVVTTDRRIQQQPNLAHPGLQQHFVLIHASTWLTSQYDQVKVCAAHHWMHVEYSEKIALEFQMKWKRMCHGR